MANGPVLVVDFGAQYAQLIARRVREAGVYSELVPHSMPVDEILAKDPKAIILSGGPASVFEPGAPTIDTKVFESGVPVLGICYGFQVMAYELGGKVDKAALGEYGKTSATIDDAAGVLADSPAEQTTWMSHGVAVEQAPAGFEVLAHTEGAPVAAMSVMSAKLEKDLRNSVNRRLNCDSANLDKAVEAAQEQLESIRKLQRAGLLDQLPDKLQLTAALRLENPELTLSELAEEFDPPVTKSCLNHRLRKITKLAKGL